MLTCRCFCKLWGRVVMPNAVWKWTLDDVGEQSLRLPQNAQILTIQIQNNKPQLWALVDTESPIVIRHFLTYYTGVAMPDGDFGQYVGTYQLDNGLVFHVFEKS